MAEINIHLFSKPEFEIDLENAKPEDFKKLGEELKERLNKIAEIIEKLENNDWERSAGVKLRLATTSHHSLNLLEKARYRLVA